jgi:adaptin ear-binding coat-associated protein 1/2
VYYIWYMQEPFIIVLFQESETIRINVKNKSATGSGMLSAAGLSGGGTVKPKASMLLESPPGAAGKH